ncbi:MAG TPA: insulinase family protein [Cyclobacteriaceae bacterium]|nr:insulinase family protein [Cyclobacteriaceae bacterium]
MKRNFTWLLTAVVVASACTREGRFETKTGESNGYTYEYVTNDPLQVRIYTLKNGLKVYLSQYKAEPRVMTSIAVKAGGKFDPANTTGLAHYLEHIMFKGTGDFGTQDWSKEKIFLDSIESMFEQYRALNDSVQRLAFYKKIDQVSNEASKYAIANEYDKMVSEIGAKGTNAYTTQDRTVYVNDVPSNQIENWLTIEANRFKQIVPRLFHTELEAVYEEKNRSLDNDYWKAYDAMNTAAFKKHPYGTQSVIGTIDHLKNPSITEIKKYFYKYYRPNNVAICLSGDLDYDKTIAQIEKAFGSWEPNNELKEWQAIQEDEVTAPTNVDVYGPNSEWLNIGFRFKGMNSPDAQLLRLTDMILSNSQAGLIDLNLKQQQKVLEPTSYVQNMNDYSIHVFSGKPREGQSLDEVKKLLLDQIDLVKKGQFDDWLIEAVINDLKKSSIEQSQYNWSRANDEVMAFTNGMNWRDYITRTDDLRKYSKQDIIKFANDHYKDNYFAIYKRNGKDPNHQEVTKPSITKVTLNKESKSPFHETLLANKVEKIQPVFVDYDKDIQKLKMNNDVEVLYTHNEENELFTLYYLSDVGTNNDPKMKQAVEYLEYLGTSDMTAEDVKKEFYKIGCNFGVSAANDRTYVYLDGLSENMDKAIALFEKLLADPKADDEALKKMIDGTFKKRDDIKKEKNAILWQGLMNYGLYGPKSSFTNVLTNKELRDVKSNELIDIIKGFTKMQHRVLYYGPKSSDELVSSLNTGHKLPAQLNPAPAPVEFAMQNMDKPAVYWTNYDMVQAEIVFLSKGEKFDAARLPVSRMFNEYFGGSMASPVFQELREAQGLAYAAFASYSPAGKSNDNDSFFGYIGTQADKQAESMKAMMGLIQNFPRSENGFEVARNSLMNQLESERITKTNILFNYENAKRRGLDHDARKDVYEQVQNMTIEDISKFQKDFIKDRKFNVVLVGDQKKLNLKDLKNYGAVKELSLDEIFGYEKPVTVKMEAPNK